MPRWLSIISYPTHPRGIIVKYPETVAARLRHTQPHSISVQWKSTNYCSLTFDKKKKKYIYIYIIFASGLSGLHNGSSSTHHCKRTYTDPLLILSLKREFIFTSSLTTILAFYIHTEGWPLTRLSTSDRPAKGYKKLIKIHFRVPNYFL